MRKARLEYAAQISDLILRRAAFKGVVEEKIHSPSTTEQALAAMKGASFPAEWRSPRGQRLPS